MGSSETDTPEQGAKTSAPQEQTPTTSSTPVYPDWSGFQAYSPIPPPGFFHSPMASSPQLHPYMWGAQQFMPPYGTPPPPYVAMYPHSGLYPHPSMPPGSHPFSPYAVPSPNYNPEGGGILGGMETDGKSSEDKDGSAMKRSKGSLGSLNMLMGKNSNGPSKTSGASADGFVSQSGDSASEGSSEGSDAHSQNDSQQKKHRRQGSDEGETSQNGTSAHDHQNGVAHPPQTSLNQTMAIMPLPTHSAPAGVAGPATNLNIGMDYWGGLATSPMHPLRGKVPATPTGPAAVPTGPVGPREPPELCIQDERELKRQRRKQSNRESARRSRLRKQAECEDLAQHVKTLQEENTSLISEVSRVRGEYERLAAENTSLKGKLGGISGGQEGSRSDRNDPPSNNEGLHLESGI